MIESLRLLCLLSLTENGDLSLHVTPETECDSPHAVYITLWCLCFPLRSPAERFPVVEGTISTGEPLVCLSKSSFAIKQ